MCFLGAGSSALLSKKGRSLKLFSLRLAFNISEDLVLETCKTYVVFLNSVLYCHLQSVHSGSTPVSFWYGRSRVTILSSQF